MLGQGLVDYRRVVSGLNSLNQQKTVRLDEKMTVNIGGTKEGSSTTTMRGTNAVERMNTLRTAIMRRRRDMAKNRADHVEVMTIPRLKKPPESLKSLIDTTSNGASIVKVSREAAVGADLHGALSGGIEKGIGDAHEAVNGIHYIESLIGEDIAIPPQSGHQQIVLRS
jgi:hypothetical protein